MTILADYDRLFMFIFDVRIHLVIHSFSTCLPYDLLTLVSFQTLLLPPAPAVTPTFPTFQSPDSSCHRLLPYYSPPCIYHSISTWTLPCCLMWHPSFSLSSPISCFCLLSFGLFFFCLVLPLACCWPQPVPWLCLLFIPAFFCWMSLKKVELFWTSHAFESF